MNDTGKEAIRRIIIIDDNSNIYTDFSTTLCEDEDSAATAMAELEAEVFSSANANKNVSCNTYELDYASQGKEGVEKIKQAFSENCPYMLAFVDMRMPPGWDGLETIKNIWQIDPSVQTVICSAYSDYSWEEIIEQLGIRDNLLILKKPFDTAEVSQLASALTEKWILGRQASLNMSKLEQMVEEKTSALKKTNKQLQQEINERKQAEQRIVNLAKFPSESPNPILRISKDGQILYANDASFHILKAWKCKEGQNLQGPQCKLVAEVLSSGKPVNFELDFCHRVFSVAMIPVVNSGYVNVYGLDVTELKLSKENLKQVREQARIKSRFVSTVSHELRTPLACMKESIGIVSDEVAGEINEEQRKFLGIAKRNIDRLARLINDILDFQKLDSDRMELNVQQYNINEVVREIQQAMIPLANEKNVDLIASVDETVPIVNIDRDKIIQVLTNLVGNAIKFTDKGNITIVTTKGDNSVRVSVKDTGIGVKKEDLPKLFHEFEQLSDTNERKISGTGLGLVISKKIVEKHNGKIWAESEFGKGTTFYFELPVQEQLAMAVK